MSLTLEKGQCHVTAVGGSSSFDEKKMKEVLEKLKVLNVKKTAEVFMSECSLCQKKFANNQNVLGPFVWRDNVIHEFEEHRHQLPQQFVRYVMYNELPEAIVDCSTLLTSLKKIALPVGDPPPPASKGRGGCERKRKLNDDVMPIPKIGARVLVGEFGAGNENPALHGFGRVVRNNPLTIKIVTSVDERYQKGQLCQVKPRQIAVWGGDHAAMVLPFFCDVPVVMGIAIDRPLQKRARTLDSVIVKKVVAVIGGLTCTNYELVKEKLDKVKIGEILLARASGAMKDLILRYCKELQENDPDAGRIVVRMFDENREKWGSACFEKRNEDMITQANLVILFFEHETKVSKDAERRAKMKNREFIKVKYELAVDVE